MNRRTLTRMVLALVTLVPAHPGLANDIALSPEQVERLNIKLEPVRRAETNTIAVLPAIVIPPLNARIVATAPFAGTVTQVLVLPGQHVTKGTPLARLSSRDLLDAEKDKSQSEAELQMAEAIAHRKRILVDKNFQDRVVAEEAEAQVAKIKAVIEKHDRMLALNAIEVGAGGSYTLIAPSDGVVVTAHAQPGDKIDAMAPAVTLDTGDTLWVEVQLPSRLVATVRPGDAIGILNGPKGRVISVGASLDDMTRSAVLYAELPPNSGLLAGQLVSVQLEHAAQSSELAVPRGSVTQINNSDAVFVRSATGFTVKAVKLRGRSTDVATVIGDFAPDAQVAASGIPQLEQMMPE